MTTAPVLDLAAPPRPADVDNHLRRSGFLLLTGHGVDAGLIRETRDVAGRFFALDDGVKRSFRPAADGAPGYQPLAGGGALARTLGGDGPPDPKESFTTGPLAAAPDPALARWFPAPRWPDVPGFAEVWTAYYRAMDELATRLLALFARALELPDDWFAAFCRHPTSTLSAVRYPATSAAIRAGEHSDYGTLTILHKQPGADDLEVRTPDGGWTRLRPGDGTLVVNTGDLLARWTGDRWVSTVHRVVGGPRPGVSLGFFHQPDADALVGALPGHGSAGYPPVRAGEHLAAKMTSQHAR